MTTVCTPTPTLTRTFTETSTSLSTTSTTSITTFPGTTSVTTITCTPQPTSSGVSAPACVPVVSTVTIPGNTSTVTIPVTVPVDVFITDTTTLFGSACSTSIPPTVSPTITPTTTPPPPPPVTSPLTTNSSSPILPSSIPNLNTSYTGTGTPSSSQPPAASNTLQDPPSAGGKSSSVAPIVGGVVGGLAVLIFLGFFTLRFIRRQHRFDNLFNDKDDDDKNSTAPFRKNPLESDFNPAFNYNPIGQQKAPSGITPPSSPPPGPSTFNNPAHGRRPSITPLLGAAAGGAAALGSVASGVASSSSSYNNGGASGPSTVSSQQALQAQAPMPAGNVQPQGYYPPQAQNLAGPGGAQPMSYPPKPQPLDTWNPATLYGPSSTSNATAYTGGLSSNPSVVSSVPQSSVSGLGYNTSVGSASVTTAVSSSWGMTSAASGSSSGARRTSTQAGFAALGQQQAHQPQAQAQQTPMLYTQYEDPFARSGSPVSIQEQRILQVVNAEPSSPSNSSYALQPLASAAQPYRIANLGPAEQDLVGPSTGVPTTATASAGAGVQQGGTGRSTARDEKGVHLNGALYQEEAPAPPAYQL